MGDRISPFIFFHWHCFVPPGYDLVFMPLFRYSVLSWHNSVTFDHAWGLHILLTNIVWKSYRWRWGHCSINTIIHWIGCTILLDGGHQRYSTNYYINRNTKRKGRTWWFTYILKKKEKKNKILEINCTHNDSYLRISIYWYESLELLKLWDKTFITQE